MTFTTKDQKFLDNKGVLWDQHICFAKVCKHGKIIKRVKN